MMRWILFALLAIVALNAVGGGVYGLSGAEGVPVAWLEGSPFSDYRIPSLFLLIGVGGSCALAAGCVAGRLRIARATAHLAGVVLLGWIVAQVAIIGLVSWLQPAMLAASVAIMILATRLPRLATLQGAHP